MGCAGGAPGWGPGRATAVPGPGTPARPMLCARAGHGGAGPMGGRSGPGAAGGNENFFISGGMRPIESNRTGLFVRRGSTGRKEEFQMGREFGPCLFMGNFVVW
ncbi:hypothetical protein GCM10010387_08260 [Streptomyces inusitatus]|uniref:Uncharacterized protein n=1 Tax=Streptomyces inusitatus TaxID=68221 RepID=A0A918PP78_9ACTN|nr:hypothetical protein GCM10010387_08260 [Streptomyces inusitatus]